MEGNTTKQKKPHLLIYAHYYIPDPASTGQIIKDLAEGLLDTFRVTVICVVPSYGGVIENKWKTQKYYHETINGVNVLRVSVPEFTKANKVSRVKNILAYFFRARHATKMVGNVDYIMSVSQPPILGGMLGAYGKKKCRNARGQKPKFIYQIQDFNPEQILAINYTKNKFVTETMMKCDMHSCQNANLIITVGRDLIETIEKRFNGKPHPKTVLINNWIDEKEIYPLEAGNEQVVAFKERYGLIDAEGNEKFVIMYSGNIGLYYDLNGLMSVIEKFPEGTKTKKGRDVAFAFVGAGAVLDKLKKYKEEHNLSNVIFIPYQKKENLNISMNAGDVHWCVNAKGIKGVSVPSKAYGIMAAGKPMIGVLEEGAEVRCLIEETGCGKCCEPGNYKKVEELVRWFIENDENEMGLKGREYLEAEMKKSIQVEKYRNVFFSA